MSSKVERLTPRERRRRRVRRKVHGTAERPRLTVYRSLRHVYAQIVDDDSGATVAFASSLDPELRDGVEGNTVDTARQVGKLIAQRAREKGIEAVVFDRNGYLYHGKVAAVADGAREGELLL